MRLYHHKYDAIEHGRVQVLCAGELSNGSYMVMVNDILSVIYMNNKLY